MKHLEKLEFTNIDSHRRIADEYCGGAVVTIVVLIVDFELDKTLILVHKS